MEGGTEVANGDGWVCVNRMEVGWVNAVVLKKNRIGTKEAFQVFFWQARAQPEFFFLDEVKGLEEKKVCQLILKSFKKK